MNRLDLASFCRQPERLGRDTEKACSLAEVQPWLDPVLGGLVDRDAVMRAQRRDAARASSDCHGP